MAGLHLQTLVSMDDMFGVSNVQKAVREYAKHVAFIQSILVIPPGASLHPDAPVTFDDLVPGKHFAVYARDDTPALVRLEQVEVTQSAGQRDIKVTFEGVADTPELMTIEEVQAVPTVGAA
jgi:hypothetical protein